MLYHELLQMFGGRGGRGVMYLPFLFVFLCKLTDTVSSPDNPELERALENEWINELLHITHSQSLR